MSFPQQLQHSFFLMEIGVIPSQLSEIALIHCQVSDVPNFLEKCSQDYYSTGPILTKFRKTIINT